MSRHAGGFDLVYLHRITAAERYLRLVRAHLPKARVIYSVADLHHVRLGRQARVEQRPELASLARATERVELSAASQSDLVITHSPVEAAALSKHIALHRIAVVPFAVAERKNSPVAERRGAAFVGSFDHAPNADAVYWLVREILPRVWAVDPGMTCKIAGHGWRADCFARLDPRVEIVGPIADLDELFSTVRLTVAPLRFGAGVKGKVLDSFAAGLPCVMSGVAAEGLDLSAPLTGLVADDVAAFAERISSLHASAEGCANLGAQARAFVAQRFSQEGVNESFRAALNRSSAASPQLSSRGPSARDRLEVVA